MNCFLSVGELVEVSGSTRQAVEKALQKIVCGRSTTWRGATLIVRQVRGRGGRSGWQYEVRADSLPLDLQERWKALQSGVDRPLRHGERAKAERSWWQALLQPVLAHPKHSRERGAAIAAIVANGHVRPNGSLLRPSERMIQRKLAAFEGGGLATLAGHKRADAGVARVILSRTWDKAVPFGDAEKERIAAVLRDYVRGLIRAGDAPRSIRALAAWRLAQITRAAGFDPGEAELAAICRVPDNFIRAEKVYRKVYTFEKDRRAFEARKPRIGRTATLLPMQLVVADVHPLDILMLRPDGSEAYPKAIAWKDEGTNRLWFDVVLLEKGQGITNADVIGSFVRMVTAWGAPRVLQIDNGAEYNWAGFIDDGLQLLDQGGNRYIEDIRGPESRSSIYKSKPYNAAAKSIEGAFSVLERTLFRVIPGWTGGDRLNPKSARVDRKVEPFPGTIDELRTLIAAQLAFHHGLPQRGRLGGRSPNAVYQAALDQGWQRTAVEPLALLLAFSTEERRRVRGGRIKEGGRPWTSKALQDYQGDWVSVRLPKFHDWARLPIRAENGDFLGCVEEDLEYHPLDREGAADQRGRERRHKAGVRALARSAPAIDVLGERLAYLADQPALQAAPVERLIAPSDEAALVIGHMRESPRSRAAREQEAKSRETQERLALMREARMGRASNG